VPDLQATDGDERVMAGSPRVISASRRTDIPALYTPWLLARLREGRCRYFHAFARKWFEVDLRPEAVRAIVFWSKNLAPLLPHLGRVAEDYPFYCHLTITGYPSTLEPGSPPRDQAVAQAHDVARRFSPEHVIWRFDPVIFTAWTGQEWVASAFARLAAELEGATRRCYFSFVQRYGKVRRRLEAAGIGATEPSLAEQRESALRLAEIAQGHGMTLHSCCGDVGLLGGPIQEGHCIDPDVLAAVGACPGPRLRPAPSREGCGCYQSIDIGAYDTCTAGCVFCYATDSFARATRAHAEHDPGRDNL